MSAFLPGALPARAQVRRLPVRDAVLAVLVVEPDPAAASQPPVVLVPGYTGSKEDFLPVLALLAGAGHRVVAMDQRGQYHSSQHDDPDRYTVDQLAADLLALLDELGGEPAHLVGHSFGGLVARAAAIAKPASVRSLVLLSSGPAGLTGPRVVPLRQLLPLFERLSLPEIVESARQADSRREADPPELAAFLRERMLGSCPVGFQAMGRALLAEPDRTDQLRASGVPVLVMHGAADDAWTPALQQQMAHRLGARHVVVAGAAHSPAVESPDATAEGLLAFFAGEGSGPAPAQRSPASRPAAARSVASRFGKANRTSPAPSAASA